MAVKIRLARGGRKKLPYYTIVIANSTSPRDGNYIEEIGTYNPLLPKEDSNRIKLDSEKYNYWVKCGAQPTETVKRLFESVNGLPSTQAKASSKKSSKKSDS